MKRRKKYRRIIKDKYKQIKFIGNTIENVVEELMSYKNKGKFVYTLFNGHKLYSDTTTIDSAYKQITGKTKEEFDKSRKDWIENYNKSEEEYEKRISELEKEWIGKGKEILSKDKWELWEEIVPIRLKDLYHGMELGASLDIIKILNKGTFEEAKTEIHNQDHSGMSFGLVCAMIKEFSDKGKEFVDYVK